MNALPPFAAFGDEISRLEVRLPILHADQVGAYNTPGRFLALRCGRRWGKAISIQEVIPTPSGWVTLEHVHAGDQVFDERGKVCTITFVTDIMLGLPANEVEFSDGTIIMACDDHRWLTTTHQERKNTARGYEQGPQIRTTRTIRETLTYGKRRDNNHAIASSRPIECPPIIPILPPYVLGVWLGDGHSNGPRYTKPDVEIAEQVALEGVSVHELKVTDGKCRLWSMAGEQEGGLIISRLRALDVLENKHIPPSYLRGSIAQRVALLQGLMDTDGYSDDKGTCEFCSIIERLAIDVLELTRSLGLRSYLVTGRATLNGKDCGPKYHVKFTTSFPVFRLPRKLKKLQSRIQRFNMEQRMIVGVRPRESVPMRCITVDSPSHLYLVSRAFIPTHNTAFDIALAGSAALGYNRRYGGNVGWFAPENKKLREAYRDLHECLGPVISSSSKNDGEIHLITGGRIDFWSLEDEAAGRSRKYHLAIIDEGAFTKPRVMMDTWEKAIKPTLFDFGGQAVVSSNTAGEDPQNFFWQICNEPRHGFAQYHAPTRNNPHLPERDPADSDEVHAAKRAEALAALIRDNPPNVYRQEYLAEFVDWSGDAFFQRDKLLVDRQPVVVPFLMDTIFAVIDTAVKTGKENDGTAVVYFGVVSSGAQRTLLLLDWDVVQIEGAFLDTWLQTVFSTLDGMAGDYRLRVPHIGAFIEDKASGMVLLQQARNRGWPAHPIDSKLTAMGKDERAISVSGYVHRGLVKFTAPAYDRVLTYKGTSGNHLLMQVTGFRIGSKDAGRQDDLLDSFTYGLAIALGNSQGF